MEQCVDLATPGSPRCADMGQRPSLAAMALTSERISAPLVLRRRPPSGACGSRARAPGSGSARACGCPRRAASRPRLSTRPASPRRSCEAVLVHGLALGLAGVVEVDYPPLELVGEMPRVPGVPHMRPSRLLRPSRNRPHQCSQSRLKYIVEHEWGKMRYLDISKLEEMDELKGKTEG